MTARRVLSTWAFRLSEDEDGGIITEYVVTDYADDPTQENVTFQNAVKGPVFEAFEMAFDEMGLVWPYVLDVDLLSFTGYRYRREEERNGR